MIPREAKQGRSFYGAYLYYCFDKKAQTNHRVAWTHTLNMLTQAPEKAWKVMAYTAKSAERLKEASGIKRTGRKLQYPVFCYSLSWHPEQSPTKAEMLKAVQSSLDFLGMEQHEALIVAHQDTPHDHCHIILNRVHPITGLAASSSYTKRKLSKFALQWEIAGGKIYSPQRKENHEMQQKGQTANYCDAHIENAWISSSNGKQFAELLREQGYQLALGRKRVVIVDPYGKIHNSVRHIPDIKTKDLIKKLSDLDLERLPNADLFANQLEGTRKQQYNKQAAKLVKELEARHLKERLRLTDHFNNIIQAEEKSLSEQFDFKATQKSISQLEHKCKAPTLLRKIFGIAWMNRKKLSALMKAYNHAVHHYEQRIGTLENECNQALDELKQQQAHEKNELLSVFDKPSPSS